MTIDTNILIAYIGGEDKVIKILSLWRQYNRPLFLSTIVETEVLSFPQATPQELQITEAFLKDNFTSVSFDHSVARIAAGIRRSTKIKFPDAAIAATALFTHTPLVTRNQKDFRAIKDLQIITI